MLGAFIDFSNDSGEHSCLIPDPSPVLIPASHGHLEALLREPTVIPRGAVVMCHPHPNYGGTMHTKAVYRGAEALSDVGFVALRFNFRGVGASTGSYDGGIGEENDVLDALNWLQAEYPGLPLIVGGFSFGSLVGMRVGAADSRVLGLFGMGLPINLERYDYSFLSGMEKPVLVVQGERDEFGTGEEAAELITGLGEHIRLVRIPDSDHYFTGCWDELKGALRGYYESGPGFPLMLPV